MRTARSKLWDIRSGEWSFALSMAGYFFLVITTFWILKPLKKAAFIGQYQESGFALGALSLNAAQAELIAKVLNMVVAAAAVVVFSRLSARFRRQQLTYIFSGFFFVLFAVFALGLGVRSGTVAWLFYFFGDLYATLMVATFFVVLNDSVTAQVAKRLYGLVGLGGVVGGAVGSMFVRAWIKYFPQPAWMGICVLLGVGIVILARYASTRAAAGDMVEDPEPKKGKTPPSGNPALDGARLALRSPYLLSIVAIVGLYEITSTLLDFQFTATVAHYVPKEDLGLHFSTVYSIMNASAVFVQLFLTGWILSQFGLQVALLVLPLSILLASGAFFAFPVLWVGSSLIVADNAFSYSLNQSAKEALYVPRSRDEKYQAKAFIDMFIQRFAKSVAVGISLLITLVFRDFSTVRWLSLVTAATLVLWILAARYAGRAFDRLPAGASEG